MTQPGWPASLGKTPQTSHMRKPQICLDREGDWAFLQSTSQYQSHFFSLMEGKREIEFMLHLWARSDNIHQLWWE